MLCLANVYDPNNNKPMFFFNDFNNFSFYDAIVGGDFNLDLNDDLDKIGGASQHAIIKLERLSAHICGQ